MTEIRFEKPLLDGTVDESDIEFSVGDRPRDRQPPRGLSER